MLFSLFSLVGLAVACADNGLLARDTHVHAQVHAKREYPQFPLTLPYRPLPWSDFNVIHTTDTHGWLLGHQKTPWPEPNYSGDLGDFASFVTHMKQIAVEKDVDLLLVDSGDLHDGTGLSDGYPPGGVDAHESNKFLERLPYDLMTIGNHELYIYADTYDMYTNFVPHLNGRYLSSNANITIFNSDGEVVSVPVGSEYVTSLGVLYDFTGNSVNTTVQFVADMVKEQWVSGSICIAPDAINHGTNINKIRFQGQVVFNAIRAVHPYTPILIFGGHSHIRDCQQYDGRTMALESGRYMETIGSLGANLDAPMANTSNITFNRRYLDQNRVTYEYHTTTSNSTFDTIYGRNITYGLQQLAVDFDLSYFYGTAPLTYTMNQNPYPSSENVLTLFVAEAAPVALAINNTRANVPNIIITNSGELRYNVFAGAFTKNDQLTAAPFTDSFYYIPNVTLSVANQVLPVLNGGSNAKRSEVEKELWGRGWVESRYRNWLQDMQERQIQMANATNLTLGYVTIDGCPGVGDDTLHIPLPYYSVPDYIASNSPNVTGDTPIDLIFVDFIESDVLGILNSVQSTTNYTSADVSLYTPTLADAVLGLYAQAMWN
ncbi:Metallo-dependent phosphatase-like protein [Boletus reticuloceps]|uniref:Metallo-dependent phosphatase-like protein n=1 Tax=Boletus reticuloceps TaxID=495285 RepID=A0A8I3AE71_9AGAM|nr:Metallo-dependent phosphatase-like protein [Boletus reticuloceps]